MSFTARMRSAVRRRVGSRSRTVRDRWADYLAGVEPALAAVPRVHRFALPPILGEAGAPPAPVAVWVEGEGELVARTVEGLQNSTHPPAAVLTGAFEQAMQSTRISHVVLTRAGDVLAPLALERLGQAVNLAADAAVFTCDDDRLDANGSRHSPRFRPGPSPDHWLADDDSGPLLVVEREQALALRSQLSSGPSWRHELAMSLGADGARHAHIPLLLCHRAPDVSDAPWLSAAALERHLRRREPGARVEEQGNVRRVRWGIDGEPSVEVIVCLRDRPALLERCATSLLHQTAYDRLSLALVDNGSVEPETLELLGRLALEPRVRVLRDGRPFNFAALNNAAACSSRADVLVFLNNDTEIIDAEWLQTLMEEALRPEVGAVAPLLVYPNESVQHAGAALGLHGYAGHPFAGLGPTTVTPFGWAAGGTRNWLAVTAACMMIERRKFESVGGFDESFVVAGNDVDLCLRLTKAGMRSLCVPHTFLIHDESRSRGAHIDPADFVRSEQRYGEFRTVGDPFYNPSLSLRSTRCEVRVPGEEAA